MNRVTGHTIGLSKTELRSLQQLFRRRFTPTLPISWPLAKELAALSQVIERQIGLLIDRHGRIEHVVIGDDKSLLLPDLKRQRVGERRLRGLRFVHTHIRGEPLSREDLTDLALNRFDCLLVLHVDPQGLPSRVTMAHFELSGRAAQENHGVETIGPCPFNDLKTDVLQLANDLEQGLAQGSSATRVNEPGVRTLLVHVVTRDLKQADWLRDEMQLLAQSAGYEQVGVFTQKRSQLDPNYLLGKGKMGELAIEALRLNADVLLFSRELSPAQVYHLSELFSLRIIDRTQLILQIFGRRARSNAGKLQVELAQRRYELPRLLARHTMFSRLTGGIGARGPGETKAEIERRRAREKIVRLEKELKELRGQRERTRQARRRQGAWVVALVGYTNAGKSTLLNQLTGATVTTQNAAFTTLDPTSRNLFLPGNRQAVLTDTVGFIRELPPDLMDAFRATLEEISEADLLLHVVDAASPRLDEEIAAVQQVLEEIDCQAIPRLLVLNKADKLEADVAQSFARRMQGLATSALKGEGLTELLQEIGERMPLPPIKDDASNA